MIIGSIGSIILSCSSMFIALRISSLPWPIFFVALASMFALKACGKTNLNEINVTHTAMSAGSMIAGGMAFVIPGIWVADPTAHVSVFELCVVAYGSLILGLIFTALVRKHFIEVAQLPFAMGQAAAETVKVGDSGGKKAGWLFGGMGVAALWTLLRDGLGKFAGGKVPVVSLSQKFLGYGSYMGVWYSPMLIGVGYVIGPLAIGVWLLGGIVADFGFLALGQGTLGWSYEFASGLKSSIGLGFMIGVGVAILVRDIIPNSKKIFGPMFNKKLIGDSIVPVWWSPIVMVGLVLLFIFSLKMPVVAAIIVIIGAWLATSMSAQCVGQTGINPLEIFGMLFMVFARLLCSNMDLKTTIFVGATVACASGLCGDVMNDFKSGYILHSDPKAQWYGELIGGIFGCAASVAVMLLLVKAYGVNCFGPEGVFPAAQSQAVAAMATGGIANPTAFIIALVAAVVLYILKVPCTTFGIGVYLPFYLTLTAAIGALIRLLVDKFAPKVEKEATGTIIASGFMAGESIMGVISALVTAISLL